MTPEALDELAEAIEPHLPRVQAGISCGNLTKRDARMEYAKAIARIVAKVEGRTASTEPRHGDRWEHRLVDGRYHTAIVASNDWPPPDPRWCCELPDEIDPDGPGTTPVGTAGGENVREARPSKLQRRDSPLDSRLPVGNKPEGTTGPRKAENATQEAK